MQNSYSSESVLTTTAGQPGNLKLPSLIGNGQGFSQPHGQVAWQAFPSPRPYEPMMTTGSNNAMFGGSPRDNYFPGAGPMYHVFGGQMTGQSTSNHSHSLPPPQHPPNEMPGRGLFGRPLSIGSPHSVVSPDVQTQSSQTRSNTELRYPVLQPHVGDLSFIPAAILCELLDTYFNNSPYVLAYVLQRASVLHAFRPRPINAALMYSMLCVAAHTCESVWFNTGPATRTKTVQKLFEMSVSALRPLQHDEVGGGSLDDVITYTQLGTIIAASEFKGVSLRWWHAAWTLAKELRLNTEIADNKLQNITELTREERRRTWWLLYMVDRHLCLCYNKPLQLTDSECSDLYHPINEEVWQSEEDLSISLDGGITRNSSQTPEAIDYFRHPLYQGRYIGPSTEVSGPGIFGFFLPLMTILGEICTIFSLKTHQHLLSFGDLEEPKAAIRSHLRHYELSLSRWQSDAYPTFPAYASQLMHTLHVLLCSKWDPIDMFEDQDGWISSDEFVQATTHAVSAAESVQSILLVDPDLAFMPFFFGIYLLQGSFLLLLIIDKLEQDSDDAVIEACEVYVRAHEVCVVTLDTQYQRNFRTVMRKTLNSVRQKTRSTEDEKSKRRELLHLYRWAKDGRGLVI